MPFRIKKRGTRPRQQARRRRPATGRPPPIPGWAMFALGLAAGLFVALLVYVNGVDQGRLGTGWKGLFERHESAATKAAKQALKETAEPGPAPQFDFYTVLPALESALPDAPAASRPQAGVTYVLQAGAYASFRDADRLKAELALAGLEAYIEKITVENKGDYYRVRLGPFRRLDRLDEVNNRLARLGIHAMRLRVRSIRPKPRADGR